MSEQEYFKPAHSEQNNNYHRNGSGRNDNTRRRVYDNRPRYGNEGSERRDTYSNQSPSGNEGPERRQYDNRQSGDGYSNQRYQNNYNTQQHHGYNKGHRQPYNNQHVEQTRTPAQPDTVFTKPVCPEYTAEELEDIRLPIENFEDVNISDQIKRGIYSYGFERPSSIQAVAIKPVLSGKDVIAQAQSGMGKTGAFVIGTLGRLDENVNATQAIVVAHTRELALQIDTVFRQIGKFTNFRFGLCIKGVSVAENIDKLSGTRGGKPHVVVGTPGRVLDMLNRKERGYDVINKSALRLFVVDEADELLSASTEADASERGGHEGESTGFLDQLYNIFKCLPTDIQVCLFSATMSPQFFETTSHFMRNPLEVLVKTEELTLDGIKQYQINVEKQEYKFDTLCELYGLLTINQSIIYCNSLKSVDYLTRALKNNNFMVSSIHGHMTPQERELTMSDFRNGKCRVLVSTDLLSRGIDVQQVSVVINYDVPSKIESYLHRIGRSGRYGRKGVAINFVTDYDDKRVDSIQKYYSTIIEHLPQNISNLLD
jgi:translation initiation factor 4A